VASTRIFGYYATVALMIVSAEMMITAGKKRDAAPVLGLYRLVFLLLLFWTAFSGILVHGFRLAGWPLMTYGAYAVHLAVAVGMLCIMLPFGKLSHLVLPAARHFPDFGPSEGLPETRLDLAHGSGRRRRGFSKLPAMRGLREPLPVQPGGHLQPAPGAAPLWPGSGTERAIDQAAWDCLTCDACRGLPRGIGIIEVIRAVRALPIGAGKPPAFLKGPLSSLAAEGKPWKGARAGRLEWAEGLDIPAFLRITDYCLFTCCTTAYDAGNHAGGRALVQLLEKGRVLRIARHPRKLLRRPGARAGAERSYRAGSAQPEPSSRPVSRKSSPPHRIASTPSRRPMPDCRGWESSTPPSFARLLAAGRLLPVRDLPLTVAYPRSLLPRPS
jgi:hypothetical protein